MKEDKYSCNSCNCIYPIYNGIVSFYDSEVDPRSFESIEAKSHDNSANISSDFMGMELYYNLKLREFIYQQFLKRLSPEDMILEIGSGTGRDITGLAKRKYRNLHASDISLQSIICAKQIAEDEGVSNRISFYHFNGANLPFKNYEFDAIFLVAALHHFRDTEQALREIKRCCKSGGYIMVFIEPSYIYYKNIRPFAKFVERRFTTLMKKHENKRSIAEETSLGFSFNTLNILAKDIGLEVCMYKTHWVLTGFVFLLQQFTYRIFRRNFSTLLNGLAIITDFVDERLTRKNISCFWHNSIIFKVPKL